MSCIDCLENCPEQFPDKCLKYTGADIESLDICTGDSLYSVNAKLIAAIQTALDGTGITIEDLTGCSYFSVADSTLPTLIQDIITKICELKEDVTDIEEQIGASTSFNTDCLDDLPSSPTRDEILQAALNKLCEVNTALEGVTDDYVKSSDLCSLVTACLASSSSTQYNTRMVPYIAYPYHGPLSNFDSSGIGITANGFQKVYICNGSNGTPDYRGRSPLGANTNVPGGLLDTAVDPALAANAGYSVVSGTKKGAYTHTLSVAESASHNHEVDDPGHVHNFPGQKDSSHASGGSSQEYRDKATQQTAPASTGITLEAAGGDQPHNNTHPVIGCNFIMYIP